MIKRIRTKFMIAAMGAVALVLALVLGLTNFINFKHVMRDLDETLDMLAYYDGHFPQDPNRQPDMTPETPYVTRYFSVTMSDDGKALDVDLTHIAAVDSAGAVRMAKSCAKNDSGFYLQYRYLAADVSEGRRIIFLDAQHQLAQCGAFFGLSFSIAGAGLIAVFIITYLLSNVVMRPIIRTQNNQRRFITNAGHDLKTPITIIDADAELLEMELGSNEWVEDIKAQTKRLASLTEELIYLSRMEEEEPIKMIDFPLSDVVEESVKSFSAPAKTNGKTIVAKITPGITLHGDNSAVQRLLSILLDNALKYSPEGDEITVNLRRRGWQTILTVSNHAPELRREDTERMFDRFYRNDSSRGSSDGFGIGLSVAEAIVTAHKGRITAELEDGVLSIITTV